MTSISHVEGQTFRDYNDEQEADAYGLGAAILVPRPPLIERVEQGQSAQTIGEHFGVSGKLVEYRIKLTGASYPLQASATCIARGLIIISGDRGIPSRS